ncbi:hypothetical protein X975_16000, partial [Stegodyphus mimosarum]
MNSKFCLDGRILSFGHPSEEYMNFHQMNGAAALRLDQEHNHSHAQK